MDLFSLYDRLFEETVLKEDSVLEKTEEETKSLDELQYLGQKGSLVYYISFDDSSSIKVYDDEGNLIRDYSSDELGASENLKDKLLYIIEDLNLDSVSYSLLQDLLQTEKEEKEEENAPEEEESKFEPSEEEEIKYQPEEGKEEVTPEEPKEKEEIVPEKEPEEEEENTEEEEEKTKEEEEESEEK